MSSFVNLVKNSFFLKWFLSPAKASGDFFGQSQFIQVLSHSLLRFAQALAKSRFFLIAPWIAGGLILSCLFIPRFSLTSIAGSYTLDVRVEDLLLISLIVIVLPIFLLKVKEQGSGFLQGSAVIDIAFILFLTVAAFSILQGMFIRSVDKPILSLLYLAKWMEYYCVFMVVRVIAETRKISQLLIGLFFATGLILAAYGYYEFMFPQEKAVYPNYYRLYERYPFHGDANHIGGFFVLWIGFFAGLYLKEKRKLWVWLLCGALIFAFFPFVWTYSRKSYFAIAGVFAVVSFFHIKNRRLWVLASLFVLLALLFPTRMAERILDIKESFISPDPFHTSLAGNWTMWTQSLWNIQDFLFFGSGLGSRHRLFYESQYVLTIAEMGILGVIAFAFLVFALLRFAIVSLMQAADDFESGILWGWLIGFGGLLLHSVSCVSFTVVKVSFPFWYLTAAVFSYVVVSRRKFS